jgi:D-xylose transport system permease protein
MFRGAAFLVADGQTVAPLSTTYARLGGGVGGSIGPCGAGRSGSRRAPGSSRSSPTSAARGAATTPPWRRSGPTVLRTGDHLRALLGFVAVVCAYPDPAADGGVPEGKGHRRAGADPGRDRRGIERRRAAHALRALRLRLWRQPEAAVLSGLPTRRVLLGVFMLMGALAAIAGRDHDRAPRFRHALDRPDGRALRHRGDGDRRHVARRRGPAPSPAPSRARSSSRPSTTAWC